jgi:N-acyl-D-amino-acid deacylase
MDLVILNGRLVNFEKNRLEAKNIGIKKGKIYTITSAEITGKEVVDARGHVISPGFIDIHNHCDYNFHTGNTDPFETSRHLLLMGVTTSIGGNCGSGSVNIKKYFDFIDTYGAPNNYMGFVGHRALREAAGIKDVYACASKTEIKVMQQLAREAIEAGGIGISLGLEYSPGASFEEVIQVCSVLRDYPGRLISAHFRYDGNRSLEAIRELVDISKETGIPMQVSHLNSGVCFGYASEALKMLETARQEGTDVMADAYPYNAASTSAGSAVFDEGCFERWDADYQDIMVAEGEYAGKRCNRELFLHIRAKHPDTRFIMFVMDEKEVDEVMLHPLVMVASDGNINNGCGHPRTAGTFPRALQRYASGKRDEALICMIEKMTRLPAQRLGLTMKGKLTEGADADIVVLNPKELKDNATYDNPVLPPSGIEYVLLNGKIVVEQGKILNDRGGKSIKKIGNHHQV